MTDIEITVNGERRRGDASTAAPVTDRKSVV